MRALLCLFAAALAAASSPLAAQVRPKPGPGDPRIQSIDFTPDQVFQLQGAPGYAVTVELSPDEQVENVAIGDSNAWQVTANHRGDHLFVKALQAVPTNMTVITNVRLYNFELVPGSPGEIAYTVRFHYPSPTDGATAAADDAPSANGEGRYKLGGDRALRPSAISDDGRHTYISWPRDRSLPAVYALNEAGRETLVNGMMRDDVFVIDSVSQKLVFRIDNRVARADRLRPGKIANGRP
ncbi:MAG TPA: TrbG/VirB9 family P-type conjugative transfer protein [Allosphingosinicella sp.]|nr:TrbG/VirB9 family P-type conjugative transfer protein [Allosphingosinicella sp.]